VWSVQHEQVEVVGGVGQDGEPGVAAEYIGTPPAAGGDANEDGIAVGIDVASTSSRPASRTPITCFPIATRTAR
jgi:hypothetical protein